MKKNQEIRDYAKRRNVKHWEIAYELGIGDCWFSRRLNREIDKDTQDRILKIIDKLAEGRDGK